jgi:NADH-quinone oxidoreductase subunit I
MHVKDAIWLLQKIVASSYEKKILLWKDRLVMPLDIAMQNAQLKNAN